GATRVPSNKVRLPVPGASVTASGTALAERLRLVTMKIKIRQMTFLRDDFKVASFTIKFRGLFMFGIFSSGKEICGLAHSDSDEGHAAELASASASCSKMGVTIHPSILPVLSLPDSSF